MVNNSPESIDCLVKPCHGKSCAVLVDSRTTQVLHPTSDLQQVANIWCDTGPEFHTE
ncbi:hypothetical protein DPMN_017567 [Dreissena polymorpha]|uniref:Uncharacterized protein n=1 Tax=Dreissena polymorpha TaxID=45954 RepID=A0A9D4S0K2_DREPO|nr:hypothetical protein DPMN_009925 [Dreissena polymorpha]KAH3893420.1 hypothetical protein DPMN_017567 [Dreissena polymorpha]